jgi:type II secretory pathway pseudopilin PulG
MTHPIASDDSRPPVGHIRNDYKRSNTFDHKRSHCKSRRGAVLIVAIVCLSIATAIAIAGVRHALMARRQARLDHQLRQTELLLDAGLRRAIKALSVDPEYQGERWALDPALTGFAGTFEAATVEIKAAAQDDGQRVFEVIAAIGPASNPAYQTKRSHRFPFPPPDSR